LLPDTTLLVAICGKLIKPRLSENASFFTTAANKTTVYQFSAALYKLKETLLRCNDPHKVQCNCSRRKIMVFQLCCTCANAINNA